MPLSIGITGLSQAGKSTLFKALTCLSEADVSGRKQPLARAAVPDQRLWKLAEIFQPKKTTPATVDFLDMPGGTSSGLGTQAISEVRTSTLLLAVVRCFKHPYLEGVDPLADLESFETELLLTDLKVVEGKLERAKKLDPKERTLLEALAHPLSEGNIKAIPHFNEEERKILSSLGLLCLKPRLVVANISEDDLPQGGQYYAQLQEVCRAQEVPCLAICAEVEAMLADLDESEKAEFMADFGLEESALGRLINLCYRKLGLQTFFTAGSDECRAWTTKVGAKAPEAAGEIHSDLQRGFIRAEVIDYPSFMECGSLAVAKEKGLLRVEGKDYVVQDGDILNIRFNV